MQQIGSTLRGTAATLLALACLAPSAARAQGAPDSTVGQWKIRSDVKLAAAQASYSENWAGGDVGTLAWTLSSNSLAERQVHPKLNSQNTLKLSFGQTHLQSKDRSTWLAPSKSNDLVDFESVERFTLGAFVDPFLSFRFESQFLDASDDANKRFMNPFVLTETAGIARVLEKRDDREWTARLGFGFRQSVDRNAFVDPFSKERTEEKKTYSTNDGGISFITESRRPIAERMSWDSKLSLFKAVFFSKSEQQDGESDEAFAAREDKWKTVDVNFENIVNADVSKYISVNLYTQLLYDKEIDLAGRFKQALAMGFTYRLAGAEAKK